MTKVLIPTDFSDNAMNALDYAVNMYGFQDGVYTIMNGYFAPSSGSGGMLVNIDDMLKKESERDMKHLLNKVEEKYPGLNVKGYSLHGDLLETLERAIKKEQAEVVVMGTQGATGLKEVLVGSNTEKVIREISAPVIAVPEHAEYSGINTIVFATDMKAIKDASVLSSLIAIAQKFDAKVEILYVVKEKEEASVQADIDRLKLDEYFKGVDHSYHVVFNDDIEDGISNFIEEEKADLLAMIPRKVNFFDRLFKRSVTKRCVYHTQTPLLAIHDND